MKQQIFKIPLLLCITMSFINCEKEEFSEIKNIEQGYKPINNSLFSVTTIESSEIETNTNLVSRLTKLNEKLNVHNKSAKDKGKYSKKYDFTVNTSLSKYIESTDGIYHSYTFLVNRSENNNKTVDINWPLSQSSGDVGHTFFSLIKNNIDGTKIIKTLGFYPKDKSFLSNMTDLEGPGVFQDNGTNGNEHDYDVSINFSNITKDQFDNIIQDLKTLANNNANYDLNDFNCTTVGQFLAEDNLDFTLEPNLSVYRWFIITGPTPVIGISPGQYGVDINNQIIDAAPNIGVTSSNNPNNLKAMTSTTDCNN